MPFIYQRERLDLDTGKNFFGRLQHRTQTPTRLFTHFRLGYLTSPIRALPASRPRQHPHPYPRPPQGQSQRYLT